MASAIHQAYTHTMVDRVKMFDVNILACSPNIFFRLLLHKAKIPNEDSNKRNMNIE